MERFVCSHCEHHFEAVSSETLVCPKCFWSTSVKKEETSPPLVAEKPETNKTFTVEDNFNPPSGRLWFWTGGILFVLLFLVISLFASRHLQKQNEIIRTIESKNAKVIASEAPELALLPEEREVLSRSISLELSGPADSEKEILARRIPFRSSLIQGVATPPWDEKQFAAFLKSQETQYRLPFEWTYKRKLTRLFKQHYLAAAAAFEAKDFLKARDEWIRSLAFPVYQNDIKKHQGVALTMLRPFVNDTLSKIGTMNSMLTDKDSYETEEKIRSDYDVLHDLLQKQSWEEADAKLLELEKSLAGVGKSQQVITPPPLPQEISLIDPDIREVLLTQVAPAEHGVRDWEALRQDLSEKEKMVQRRLPGALDTIRQQYEEALRLIKNGNWKEARELLQKFDYPETLREDAHAKLAVLNKSLEKNSGDSAGPSLDSRKKTS